VNHATRSNLVLVLLLALISLPAQALHYRVRHSQHFRRTTRRSRSYRHHRHVVWTPVLHGSHDSLVRQNEEIDRLGLPRIADDQQLEGLEQEHELVAIRESRNLAIHPQLAPQDRYCKSWTREFLQDLAAAHYREFHSPVQVNSAVRTVKVQRKLRRHNRNAAPWEGDTASSHLTGVTVDLQRRGMSKDQARWMEHYLFYMKALNLVEPEEERHQWVFHVMVSGHYSEWRETQSIVPMERPDHDKPQQEKLAADVAMGAGGK